MNQTLIVIIMVGGVALLGLIAGYVFGCDFSLKSKGTSPAQVTPSSAGAPAFSGTPSRRRSA